MTTLQEDEAVIRFEGLGSGGNEIWGATLANFLVALPGYRAREVAVMLNDPSVEFLAEQTGNTDSPEFRARAAEFAGQIWIGRQLADGGHIGPTITLSRATLEQYPDFLAELEAALRAATV